MSEEKKEEGTEENPQLELKPCIFSIKAEKTDGGDMDITAEVNGRPVDMAYIISSVMREDPKIYSLIKIALKGYERVAGMESEETKKGE